MSAPDPRRIAFRPLTAGDLPRLARWLEAPHVARWWGEDPAEELEEIRQIIAGIPGMTAWLVLLDGEPVGHIQNWRLGHFQTPEWLAKAPWVAAFAPDTTGIDILIGEARLTGQGLGPAILTQFVAKLVAEGARHIIIDPDIDNHIAISAYRKAGFRPVPRLDGKTGDTLILEFTPRMAPSA